MKSEHLNLLECSGPVQACTGIALPVLFYWSALSMPFAKLLCWRSFLSVCPSCVSIVASWIIRLKSFARPHLDYYVMFPPERWLPFSQVGGSRSRSSGMSCYRAKFLMLFPFCLAMFQLILQYYENCHDEMILT